MSTPNTPSPEVKAPEVKAPEAKALEKPKGKPSQARVEIKGTEAPKPGSKHTFTNNSGTTITTSW